MVVFLFRVVGSFYAIFCGITFRYKLVDPAYVVPGCLPSSFLFRMKPQTTPVIFFLMKDYFLTLSIGKGLMLPHFGELQSDFLPGSYSQSIFESTTRSLLDLEFCCLLEQASSPGHHCMSGVDSFSSSVYAVS